MNEPTIQQASESTKIALIFPGQGAQKVGMGKEFYDQSLPAKNIFNQANAVLGKDLTDVIFNGPQEKLTETSCCQPGILTFSVAALMAFKAHAHFKKVVPCFSAGLSLGEYSALVACGALDFKQALKLVDRRGSLMEESTRLHKGAMAAIIGFDIERLKQICAQTKAEVANYNSPEQIVITGAYDNVHAACQMIKDAGARTVIPLDVSGAFHSSLMTSAAEKFKHELAPLQLNVPVFPVLSNVDATPETSPEKIKSNLSKQIVSSVQWEATVRFIASQGVSVLLEIGPGKVLKGLIRKINPNLQVFNIEKPQDIESLSF